MNDDGEEEPWEKMDRLSKLPPPDDPTILQRLYGNTNSFRMRTLKFCMLGCEPNLPYGPHEHTAGLLADLIGMAAEKVQRRNDICWIVQIHMFDTQKMEYPKSYEPYNGVLLPGSFSSAYETDKPWMEQLKQHIQNEIVKNEIPTLAICFGHQILAHSFLDSGGRAVPTPTGPRAGAYPMTLSNHGRKWLLSGGDRGQEEQMRTNGDVNNSVSHRRHESSCFSSSEVRPLLYYTHGDMVERLPSNAVNLGGNGTVPIQAAAYFRQNHKQCHDDPSIFAISFQGHPEYATSKDLGVFRTLHLCMNAMCERGNVAFEQQQAMGQEALDNFEKVQQDSIDIMVAAGRLLGWFPRDGC